MAEHERHILSPAESLYLPDLETRTATLAKRIRRRRSRKQGFVGAVSVAVVAALVVVAAARHHPTRDVVTRPGPATTSRTNSGGTATPGSIHTEVTGGPANTWSDYLTAGGQSGPEISSNASVQIACRITGFKVNDGNTWWYRIASAPWNDRYYVSADAFYNDGSTSGSLKGTPFFDPRVQQC